MKRLLAAALLSAAALATMAAGPATPAPGPVRIVQNAGGGCIQGAVRLPDMAPGIETIRRGKSSFWGHPDTIARLLQFGREAQAAGLPVLYMGDLSGPRGGPLAGGHVSHQVGMDADIYLDVGPRPALTDAQRETLEPPSLVRPDGRAVDPARWKPQHATLLRLAVGLPSVDRILVNAAIKKQLCDTERGDRAWLRFVRPWYGHASHLHIRFRCPADQPECVQAPPPPAGEGCDASLQWWFDRLDTPPKPQPPSPRPPRPPPLPAACAAIFKAPG